jgi:hypothetical protein
MRCQSSLRTKQSTIEFIGASLFSSTHLTDVGFVNRTIAKADLELVGHRIAEELLEGNTKPCGLITWMAAMGSSFQEN